MEPLSSPEQDGDGQCAARLPKDYQCQSSGGHITGDQIAQQGSGELTRLPGPNTPAKALHVGVHPAGPTHSVSVHCWQMAFVVIKDDGVSVRWEDKSKSLQSSVWLSSEVTASHGDAPNILACLAFCSVLPVSLQYRKF